MADNHWSDGAMTIGELFDKIRNLHDETPLTYLYKGEPSTVENTPKTIGELRKNISNAQGRCVAKDIRQFWSPVRYLPEDQSKENMAVFDTLPPLDVSVEYSFEINGGIAVIHLKKET